MSRIIAVTVCGFMLAACSTTMPSLDFMKSAPQVESLTIESEPRGAEAKTSLGQSCRTPCQLSARERILRHVCAERLPAADRVGTFGGGRRNCCSTPRAQSGSRGPAGSGPGKEAGCEEKEARSGSGWSSSDGPHGLGSAYAGADVRPPCSCPHALGPNGDGTVRDQLSLVAALVPSRTTSMGIKVSATS